jgi:nucleotide-binding universal stress UspA family protein
LVRIAETFRDELPTEPPFFPPPTYEATLESILEHFEKLESEARDYLADVAERLRQEGIQVSTEVLSGNIWRQAVAYVDREQPDLVVMATHARGGLSRWFLGSIADRLVTASEVPILLTRATGDLSSSLVHPQG